MITQVAVPIHVADITDVEAVREIRSIALSAWSGSTFCTTAWACRSGRWLGHPRV